MCKKFEKKAIVLNPSSKDSEFSEHFQCESQKLDHKAYSNMSFRAQSLAPVKRTPRLGKANGARQIFDHFFPNSHFCRDIVLQYLKNEGNSILIRPNLYYVTITRLRFPRVLQKFVALQCQKKDIVYPVNVANIGYWIDFRIALVDPKLKWLKFSTDREEYTRYWLSHWPVYSRWSVKNSKYTKPSASSPKIQISLNKSSNFFY